MTDMPKHPLRLIALLVAVLALANTASAQRRYQVEAIAVDAIVQADGALSVREALTYDYRGAFTFAYRNIPLNRTTAIRDVGVSEDGRAYRRADSKEPGTYQISRSGNSARITWYYRADNQRRTFDLSYTIAGAVHRYPDVAEFYYKFVGDDWDRPIGRVHAAVRFAGAVSSPDLRAWAHGPLSGHVEIEREATVSFDVAPLPAHRFWEGRVLFPPQAVDALALASTEPRADTVQREERAWVEEANARRASAARREAALQRAHTWAMPFFLIAIGLGVAALLTWFAFYGRVGRSHPVEASTAIGQIPSRHPPAVVGALMSRDVGSQAIVATLLDLARRGYLDIRETVDTRKGLFGTREHREYCFERTMKVLDDLAPFERSLLEFMLGHGESPTSFTMAAIKRTASRHARDFQKWFSAWKKAVIAEADRLDFYEPPPTRAITVSGLASLAVFIMGIVLCFVSRSPAGIPAIVGGIVAGFLALTLRRRTPEGQRLFVAWSAFRSYLKAKARSGDAVEIETPIWERYLAAAVILGLQGSPLSRLRPVDARGQAAMPIWLYARSNGGAGSFSSDVSSMVSAMSTSMSSVSGGGGGATGGGGGGAGGGGGGAG